LNNLAASITEEVTLLSAKQQTKEVAESLAFRSLTGFKYQHEERTGRLQEKLSLLDQFSVYDYEQAGNKHARRASAPGYLPLRNTVLGDRRLFPALCSVLVNSVAAKQFLQYFS